MDLNTNISGCVNYNSGNCSINRDLFGITRLLTYTI